MQDIYHFFISQRVPEVKKKKVHLFAHVHNYKQSSAFASYDINCGVTIASAATNAASSENSIQIPGLTLFLSSFSLKRKYLFHLKKTRIRSCWGNVEEYGFWSHSQISSVVSSVPFPPQHIMKGTLRSTTARHCTHFFIKLAQSERTEE